MKKVAIVLSGFCVLLAAAYFVFDQWLKPSIELIKVSSASVVSMRDTLAIELKFWGRDGDIGDSSIGQSKVFVEDSVYKVVQEFPIITGSYNHTFGPVTGRLKVLVDLLPFLDTSVQRTTRLRLYITDRGGHKSNIIETPNIYISRIDIDQH